MPSAGGGRCHRRWRVWQFRQVTIPRIDQRTSLRRLSERRNLKDLVDGRASCRILGGRSQTNVSLKGRRELSDAPAQWPIGLRNRSTARLGAQLSLKEGRDQAQDRGH